MKAVAITIFKHNKQNPLLLASATDLSSFSIWQRSTLRELITFTSREILKKQPGYVKGIFDFNEEYKLCVSVDENGLCCVIITDMEYPLHVNWTLITQITEKFTLDHPTWKNYQTDQNLYFPYLYHLLTKMQNPANVDKITEIQNQLKDTERIVKESLAKLNLRTEELKELSQKSKDLSEASKIFVIESEKLNSCCLIL